MSGVVWCLLLALLASCSAITRAQEDPQTMATKEVLDKLNGKTYDPAIRPTKDGSSTVAEVQTYIRDINIDDVDMKVLFDITFRMIWMDERLAYDVPGVDYVTVLEPSLAWRPDAFFKNAITTQLTSIYPESYLRVFPDGRLIYSTRLILNQNCPMDLSRFPHDTQECRINIASYGYTMNELEFRMAANSPVSFGKGLHTDRFRFEKHVSGYCNSKTATGEYSCVEVMMKIRRVFGSYLLEWYIPTIFLVIVSWFGFLIPADQFLGRLLLTLIPLITLSTFSAMFKQSLASVPYGRAVDIFTGISLAIIFLTLVYVIVSHVRRNRVFQKTSDCPEEGEAKTTITNETGGARRLASKVLEKADFVSRLTLVGTYCAFLFVYFVAYCGTG